MSLLLDALQRASKEKEKLAEARVSADKPSPAIEPVPSDPVPPLAIDFGNHEPNVPSTPAAAPTPPGLATDAEPARTELTLDPGHGSITETFSVTGVSSAQSAPDVPPQHAAVASAVASADKIENVPEPATVRREPTVPAPPVDAAKSVRHAAPEHPSPVISPQVAREILGATAKKKASKPRPNRRLVALGSIALLIAIANAAFFLGFMDQFLGTSSPGLAPSVPPPPVAVQSPSPSVPIQAAAVDAPGDSDVPAARTGSRREDGSVVALQAEESKAAVGTQRAKPASRATGAKTSMPVFIAKPAAASALDTAYGALTEGRLDDAVKGYLQALEKNPGERDALLGMAYIAQRQGDREEARAYYQRVLRQDPTHPGASAGMLTLAAEGDLQMTASRAREMAERNPGSAVVLSTLGGILAREGRISEAQQAYFRALTLEPDNAFHAYNLAVALDRLHKYGQARTYYQRALALAEKSVAGEQAGFPRKDALQRLEQLREQLP